MNISKKPWHKMIAQLSVVVMLLSLGQLTWAKDKLNVLACEPEWAALSYELGGSHMNIYSATTYRQDPHHIQARPSLIAKARNADLLVCSGAELEIGWLPVLLKKSGNKKIQRSASGYFMATDYVTLLDKKAKVSRSMGDVHAAGNPHIHFDPRNVKKVAAALHKRLIKIDPQRKATYDANYENFSARLHSAMRRWQNSNKALANKRVVVHHDNWIYLTKWLKIERVASLEPKPGVPPSSSHLSKLLTSVKNKPVDFILLSSYQDPKAAKWLSKKRNVPYVIAPYSVAQWNKKNALIAWYDDLLGKLKRAAK